MKENLREIFMAFGVVFVVLTWAIGISCLMTVGYYLYGVLTLVIGLVAYIVILLKEFA